MLAAVLALLLILIPWAALRQPSDLAAVAVFDERLFTAPQGKPVGRAFAVVILCTVVIPTFLVVGSKYMAAPSYGEALSTALTVFDQPARVWGDAMWVLGIALIPVAVVATTVIWVKMRQLDSH